MIEKTLSFKCKPSQLVNLENFLLTLLVVPVVMVMNEMLKTYVPSILIPEKLATHIYRFPVYLSVLALLNLAYQILRVWCIRYEIDTEELRYYSGVLSRKHEYIELYRVKDFLIERPLIYRLFGLGNLTIYTSDKTTPVLHLYAIREPEKNIKFFAAWSN